ncbi:MAG: hypothetical protein ACLPID_03440 [Beijerinckiaceae bacterium]
MGSYIEDVLVPAAFRQVENGYVFSAPWFAGPSRHYLVNEAQKMAIAECMRRTERVLAPARTIAMVFGAAMIVAITIWLRRIGLLPSISEQRWFTYFDLIAWCTLIFAAAHIYRIHKLRPLLAGLPPTLEPEVTQSEVSKLQAARTSWSSLVWRGLVVVAFAACFMSYIVLVEIVHMTDPADEEILRLGLLMVFLELGNFYVPRAWYKARRS